MEHSRSFGMRAGRLLAIIGLVAVAGALLLKLPLVDAAARQTKSRPNILFIAVDDLNHWVRHLNRNKQAITPNIDRLAKRGVTFTNAHCVAPACNPSRAALMSGLRPSTTGVYLNANDWRPHIAEGLTLTSYLRQHGYYTAGTGKIYHGSFDRQSEWHDYLKGGGGGDCRPKDDNDGVGGIKFAPVDCQDNDLPDYRITDYAIEQLKRQHDRPFFLAMGLHKPHMPWNVPRKYYEMYPLDKIELPPHRVDDLNDIPAEGLRMANAAGDHAAILKSGRWKEAVQAYLAAITYTDMNIGRLLDALDQSQHRDNTIIVLWGDHGWNLGEKQHWRKFSLWEESTRAPFIWVVPNVTKPGTVSPRTVDFMSIYPTLAELAGLPIPGHVEGVSIKPLLTNPTAAWTRPALTTHGYQNHAVRTEQWRYIRYHDGGEELYDETKDPYEWRNLAGEAKYAKVKAELAQHLPKVNQPEVGRVNNNRARPAPRRNRPPR